MIGALARPARADESDAVGDALDARRLDAAYRLAAVVLRDPIEAEDAVQDAAVVAARRFRQLREPDRFDAWFGRIVVNQCRDRLRAHGRDRVRDAKLARGMPDAVADAYGSIARHDAIARAFARLDPDLQIVVVLRFYRDLPLESIAELAGVPLGTVKSRLHTALRRLRAELERTGWEETP